MQEENEFKKIRKERDRERDRQRTREDYMFYKGLGICPVCRKKRAAYGFVNCPECIQKDTDRMRKRYADPVNRAAARVRQKRRYERLKALGLCASCGSKAPVSGGVRCTECGLKQNKWYQANRTDYYAPGERMHERADAGLCSFCGKPQAPGCKVCPEHQEQLRRNSH